MDALKTDIIFLSVAPLNDEKFLNYFVLCIIGRTMDDDCLVSVNKLQGVIDVNGGILFPKSGGIVFPT